MRRVRRLAARSLVILLVVAAVAAVLGWAELRGSLAVLDGERRLAGLASPVSVERDALGIPTLRGDNRTDLARATGFVHGQDRFFQMDLARRRAAGELAALVGARALPVDREIRIHRFRDEARRAVELMPPSQRQLLDAYVAGVNAGLAGLSARPFEYLLLRQQPVPWRAEDTLLVALSMFVTLQESRGDLEATRATMYEVLPRGVADFFMPPGTEWDTPVVGDRLVGPAVPGPEIYDLRAQRARTRKVPQPARPRGVAWLGEEGPGEATGSNNWAVSGTLTAGAGALVANDMHLGIRVPNTWYRAVIQWQDQGAPRQVAGLTLPGTPAIVVGSNTNIAWGFTNAYADTSDIVLLDTDPARPDEYLTPDGWRRFERFDETIGVAGANVETLTVRWTIWGPVLPPDFRGRPRAYRWVAHSAERLSRSVTPLEDARTISEAFDEANQLGTPAQNMVVADRSGRIGWTIYGSLPARRNLDGRLPQSWSDGASGWSGWLEPARYPRISDPPGDRLWTANARVVDGAMLAALGDGNWEVGSRARIIRERLFAKETFSPEDLLAIQLDTRAEFLERWRQLILDTLTAPLASETPTRRAFRDVVEHGWNGEAAADSAAYRLTRMFRDTVSQRVLSFALAECYEQDERFDYSVLLRREGPLWALVSTRPLHWLDPDYASWSDLFVASIDDIVDRLEVEGTQDLRSRIWSQMNVTAYRHPLSAAVPLLARWLDMPERALPGDLYTPNMHWGAQGPSERMVVSPGREAEGILHMPTGQSGHPLSPFYFNSHDAWLEGRPTPFLPGPPAHRLTLVP